MVQLIVFSLEQPGGIFYYSKVKTTDLVNGLEIRRRSKRGDGVQRDLDLKRIRDISDYLSTADAILPTPLVISVETAELATDTNGTQTLHIESNANGHWGEIIDGQHRYEGLLTTNSFNAYEIPVCIFVDLAIEDKATVFATINSTQVKVPKSYIYDLFDYTDANVPAKFCHDVCKTLNYDPDGPLTRRVKMLGRKLDDSEVLSQGALVDAMIPLITTTVKQDDKDARAGVPLRIDPLPPLRPLYVEASTVVFAKVVRNFLEALRVVSGDNWERYALRSIGIKVFMRLLGHLAKEGMRHGNLSREYFFGQLSKIQPEVHACTTTEGTNKKAEEETVSRLIAALAATTSSGP